MSLTSFYIITVWWRCPTHFPKLRAFGVLGLYANSEDRRRATGDPTPVARERESNAFARGGSMLLGASEGEKKIVSDEIVHDQYF
jgi:hypothetical protein